MNGLKITNKILKYTIFIAIFFMLVGLTYSYFVADLEGAETDTTITAEAGYMNIVYNGGPNITAEDLAPSTEAFATKTFTVTGNSNIAPSEMGYKITLIVDENTLTENAISYTLTGTNTSGNGNTALGITERQGLGINNVVLGIGKFEGKVTNGIHTYELKLYFYETNEDQTIDMNKTFRAHIGIENHTTILLSDYIINLASDSANTGLYNENGYRYEGLNPNNYLSFNNETWRIIGVFDSDTHGKTGQNLVKIIRNDSIGNYAWDSGNVNNWNTSSLKTYLNGDYYNGINASSKNLIENVTWKLGGNPYDSPTPSQAYTAERGTAEYSGRPTSGEGYIGLMYPSDYGYAVLSSSCSRTQGLYSYDSSGCYNQNWLFKALEEWTITPYFTNSSNVRFVTSYGHVYYINASNGWAGRPSLYLKSNTTLTGGDGSSSNPYTIGD